VIVDERSAFREYTGLHAPLTWRSDQGPGWYYKNARIVRSVGASDLTSQVASRADRSCPRSLRGAVGARGIIPVMPGIAPYDSGSRESRRVAPPQPQAGPCTRCPNLQSRFKLQSSIRCRKTASQPARAPRKNLQDTPIRSMRRPFRPVEAQAKDCYENDFQRIQLGHRLDQVFERPPQPVEPPDRQHIARSQRIVHTLEAGAMHLAFTWRAPTSVADDALAAMRRRSEFRADPRPTRPPASDLRHRSVCARPGRGRKSRHQTPQGFDGGNDPRGRTRIGGILGATDRNRDGGLDWPGV
jgi:hypothetical protein